MSLKLDLFTQLRGDWNSIFLLLLLYTLQGLPIGMAMSIPVLLTQRGVSYADQAIFSLASWPFSLKLLWAPIVDSIWLESFGRRKSWLIPTQLAIGTTMLWMSTQLPTWVPKEEGSPVFIYTLSAAAFCLFFLTATQDIAVDGWGLTMMSHKNVGYVSSCNVIGQQVGYLMAYIVFLALSSADFCNTWLRPSDQASEEGMLTLEDFLWFWGIVFIVVTLGVAIFRSEKSSAEVQQQHVQLMVEPPPSPHSVSISMDTNPPGDTPICIEDLSPKETYMMMWKLLKLPYFITLVFLLATCKAGLAAGNAITSLKLIEKGADREFLAVAAVVFTPVEILSTVLLSKWIVGHKPLKSWFYAFPIVVLTTTTLGFMVVLLPYHLEKLGGVPSWFLLLGIPILLFNSLGRNVQFTAIMAYFTFASDPLFGGTNMTVLNTIANLGGKWPEFIVFMLVERLNWTSCEVGTTPTGELKQKCVQILDGFSILLVIGLVYSILWAILMKGRIKQLTDARVEQWRLATATQKDA